MIEPYDKIRHCEVCHTGFVLENETSWNVEGAFLDYDEEDSHQGGEYVCNKCFNKFEETRMVDKTRELVDQLLYELDNENGDKENARNRLHTLAWELVNATRPEENPDD